VVIDDEYFALVWKELRARHDCGVVEPRRRGRQPYPELAPASRPCTARLDGAIVQCHESLRKRQTDAKSAGRLRDRGFELREHVEYRFEPFVRNTVPGVADAH